MNTLIFFEPASKHTIAVYCRRGLIRPVETAQFHGWFFDDEAIRAIRRIEYLRHKRQINLEGVSVIFDLLGEIERLERELRFFRDG
jgi:DNA-binding transcriptional MerR regulator